MYTSQANIESKLGSSLTKQQASYYSNVLGPAIDSYINNYLGTKFSATDPSSIYVTGDGTTTLVSPTLNTLTAVTRINDDGTETAVDTTEYYNFPRAGDVYAVKRYSGVWEEGVDYKLTAKLGYASVPADIQLVATELAIIALKENLNNYKREKVGDWEVMYSDIGRTLSDTSQTILDSYRRLSRMI